MKYKNAIVYGLLSGVVIICYHLGVYFGMREWLVSSFFFFSIYLVQVPFMVSSGLSTRAKNEGLIDFKDALREVFITFLIGMIIYFICYYVFFGFNEELIALQKEQAHENIMWLKEQGFYDKDEIKKMIDAWETNNYKVGIGHIIKGIPFRIMGGFVLSALVALMVKR